MFQGHVCDAVDIVGKGTASTRTPRRNRLQEANYTTSPAATDPNFAAVRMGALFHLAFDGGRRPAGAAWPGSASSRLMAVLSRAGRQSDEFPDAAVPAEGDRYQKVRTVLAASRSTAELHSAVDTLPDQAYTRDS